MQTAISDFFIQASLFVLCLKRQQELFLNVFTLSNQDVKHFCRNLKKPDVRDFDTENELSNLPEIVFTQAGRRCQRRIGR
jgi:hypothetical protein